MRRNLYSFLFTTVVFLLFTEVQAQYQWRSVGPDNLSSIMRGLAFDNSANLFAGSQGGGLWRSTDLGDSWTKITSYDDALCNPNITSIAIEGSNIFVATGATQFTIPYVERRLGFQRGWDYRAEKNGFVGYLDGLPGGGVYVSSDNGQSWKNVNATNSGDFAGTLTYQGAFTDVQKVITSNSRVFMGTHAGLYYSDDLLNSVNLSNGSAFFQENVVFDIEVAANNTIFAVVHRDIDPTDSLFISTDNGASFQPVTNPEIYTNQKIGFARSEVAVSPTDPNIVYLATTQASGEVGKIFRYDLNAGGEWQQIGVAGPTFNPLGIGGRDAFVLSVYPDNPQEIILAGQNWFSFEEENGWQLIGQGFTPALPTYRETPIYSLAFHPTDPNILAIGTASNLFISKDRGNTFASRNRGIGTHPVITVNSVKATTTEEGESTQYEAVIAGGKDVVMVNHLFNSGLPSENSFGTIAAIDYTKIAHSVLFPGGLIIQGTDGGLLRSLDLGLTFEQFYQIPISPQVANLVPAGVDTIINQSNANSQPGNLLDAPTPAQSVWALDEYIPSDILGQRLNLEEEVQANQESYLFFCSQKYVWLVQGVFGEALQVRWNRLTSELVDGQDEVFTAMTIAPDGSHTVYVASNKGNIWRIDNAADLANFDADVNVVQLNEDLAGSGLSLIGNWISSMAIDPQNPNRLVLTYAGYGAINQGISSWLWLTDSATNDVPEFGRVAGLPSRPIYDSEFVVDPSTNESVLLLATEAGMLSIKNIVELGPRLYAPDGNEAITDEIPSLKTTPVTDIFIRKHSWEEDGDFITINSDYETFVATYGQGIWTSADFVSPKKAEQPKEPIVISNFFSKIYPNPGRGDVTLQLNLPEAVDVELRVLDLQGKTFHAETFSSESGILKHELPSGKIAEGLYIVELTVKGKTLSEVITHKWAHF